MSINVILSKGSRVCVVVFSCILLITTIKTSAAQSNIQHSERLSQWLLRHQSSNIYPPGLMWLVPEEQPTQAKLKQHVIEQLTFNAKMNWKKKSISGLLKRLNDFPVTGRVSVAMADPQWLEVHPEQDPILQPGQSVRLSSRPTDVTVLFDNGRQCLVHFFAGATADAYINACLEKGESSVDYAWIAQPDGAINRYGIAIWNEEPQDPPAPGAWIWAPRRMAGMPHSFSDDFTSFLATQGPSQRSEDTHHAEVSSPVLTKKRAEELTSNDWGLIGLLQMPSARMKDSGEVRLQLTRIYPYFLSTVMFQPLDWLEAGFRYVNIKNQWYDSTQTISHLSMMDKSFDIKLRLLQESAYVPQLAFGAQDLAGTGLFSGEYIVASKRTRDVDWNLGVAWGYVGARGAIRNPFSRMSPEFINRTNEFGEGGGFMVNSYFHGPAAIFGGVQWHTPLEALIMKLEFDANDHQSEPFSEKFLVKSPINVGFVYRLFPSVDLDAGFERGTTLMLGLTLHTALDKLQTIKPFEQAPPPVLVQMPETEPDWSKTANDIHTSTGWSVNNISVSGTTLRLQVVGGGYRQKRLATLIAILHRDTPAYITRFVVVFVERGMKLDSHEINRTAWVMQHTEARAPSQQVASLMRLPPLSATQPVDERFVWKSHPAYFSGDIVPYFVQSVGGPDAYVLYQAGFNASGEIILNPSTSIAGTASARVVDNYNDFKYDGPSLLPRVRTDIRKYVEASRYTLPNLQLTHVAQISDNQFVSVYGGLLEMMFTGIGGEWLYRPWQSQFALGVDFNYVRQRGYAQNFSLLPYQVNTGQFSLYWDTGWNGILTQLSAGQYLAGDRGVSLDVSRCFDNGVVIGAYVTKTNISAEQFGEGSFNKGIYISIPFDAMLPVSTHGTAYFNWQPLLRDGGAKLYRVYTLYDLTSARDLRAAAFGPAN